MFNHITVGSNDIERSKHFYDAVLGTLGAGEPMRNRANSGHIRLFYRHDGTALSLQSLLTMGRQLLPMVAPSHLHVIHRNKYKSFTTLRSQAEGHQSKNHLVCATAVREHFI